MSKWDIIREENEKSLRLEKENLSEEFFNGAKNLKYYGEKVAAAYNEAGTSNNIEDFNYWVHSIKKTMEKMKEIIDNANIYKITIYNEADYENDYATEHTQGDNND